MTEFKKTPDFSNRLIVADSNLKIDFRRVKFRSNDFSTKTSRVFCIEIIASLFNRL